MFTKMNHQQIPVNRDGAAGLKNDPGRKQAPQGRITITRLGIFVMIVAAMYLVAIPASAYETPESIVAASKVYISKVTYDPGSFFSGDTGTVRIAVTNANTNQSAVVNHATFGDEVIKLTSLPYQSTTNIGPLQTQEFVFSVAAGGKDGTYYPTFSLGFRDADSIYSRATVKIDSSPLVLTIVDKPDAYRAGQKKTISAQVANPRDNAVKNAILEVSGPGITANPDKIYIGDIAAGAKIPLNFTITPDRSADVTLNLTYDNGDNRHQVTQDLPITLGADKKEASPQMSNVKAKLENGICHITGDVTNAGLTNANGVTVTSLSPASPQDPYRSYVIGALKPDDFGSFEVTFTANGAAEVPLQITYKDTDGNIITSEQTVSLAQAGQDEKTGQSASPLPVIAAVLVLAGIAGGCVYLKRKKNQ